MSDNNNSIKPNENNLIPFDGDNFDRLKTAEELTRYIDKLKEGTVIAINAPWSEGKSWFGRNWKVYLKKLGYKTVLIDAFAHDYIEDPFLLISAEINTLEEKPDELNNLRKEAGYILRYSISLATKFLVNSVGRFALGTENLPKDMKELAEKSVQEGADDLGNWVSKKFKEYENEKIAFTGFKQALTNFCSVQNKPVIIFIDELDRCKPTFAVELIERIKHFFDVPKLIFILLINNSSLDIQHQRSRR